MVWLFFCHLIHILTVVANEVLLYGIITVLSIEFKLLRVEIEKLVEKKDENLKMQIKNIIKRHQELLAISSNIEEIYSPSFFCNFILSSIVISFTAIRASIAYDPVELVFCLMFCSVTLILISLQCFFGQLLKQCSDEIAFAIFNCDWINFSSISSKRILLMFLMRSQKSSVLTALKFSEINLGQLTGVSNQRKIIKTIL
ncbi:hypothetical protein PVAND_006430 [Polypedilum vanderplanki]|nr:hypothetical protein PVAND_006430 [Polypedilum vanderplanki]